MKEYIFNHNSPETALEVTGYPWGFRLKTSIFYWIETVAKKGDRFCHYTIDPRNGRKCTPKKSTFINIAAMFRDEKGHIHWEGVSLYTKPEVLAAWIESIGGEGKLNPEQCKQLRQLRGEKIAPKDPITGDDLKDYTIKWAKDKEGKCDELRITFGRPDGVRIKEIFEAMKSVNQQRLQEVFEVREYGSMGSSPGTVRIYCRGGVYLGTVKESEYKEYLASDYAQDEEVKGKIEIDY